MSRFIPCPPRRAAATPGSTELAAPWTRNFCLAACFLIFTGSPETMDAKNRYFVFQIDEQRYAMALHTVEKVIRAVQLTCLPDAPQILLGLINMHGRIIPVFNIRRRFNLPDRRMKIDDRIIVCHAAAGTIAFTADRVEGIVEFPQDQMHEAQQAFPEIGRYVDGVGKLDNSTVLIYDLNRLFSIREIEKIKQGIDDGRMTGDDSSDRGSNDGRSRTLNDGF